MMLHAVGVNDLLLWMMLLHIWLFLMSCSTTSENREAEDGHLLKTFLFWTWYSR